MSESAAKEYQIEEALTKMEAEWKDSRLEIVGYRETGTGILKGVDEINTVLDEQVTDVKKISDTAATIVVILPSPIFRLERLFFAHSFSFGLPAPVLSCRMF